MRKKIFIILLACLMTFVVFQNVFAQLEEAIEQLPSKNTKGYLQPLMDGFGNNLNSGLFQTAKVSKTGLSIYVGLAAMVTLIPNDNLSYMGYPSEPFTQTAVKTASVFGEKGAVVQGPSGLSHVFPDGQLKGTVFPLGIPHIEVGSYRGTKLKLRWLTMDLPGDDKGTLGRVEFLGYGLQHSISQYIPLFPVNISASIFRQNLKAGDLLDMNAMSYGIQASKSFSVLTVYGGLSLNSANMDVSYTYKAEDEDQEISLELESKTQARLTLGAALRMYVFMLNGDINFGNQTSFSLGLGLGI